MKPLVMIESILNALDTGIFLESLKNAFKTQMEMGMKDFFKHLILGKGYGELTPPQLTQLMASQETAPLIIDLREKRKFQQSHIPNAVLHPFDFFLREILIDDGYRKYRRSPVVLVCDTGHQSRVAASILAREGFRDVSSLNRGMRRYHRWEALMSNCEKNRKKKFHACSLISSAN